MGQILHGSATSTRRYHYAKRLKALHGLTPYEAIRKAWADEPDSFKYDPTRLTSGLNT